LKLDISGFFMNIDKDILFRQLKEAINKHYFGDDKDMILYLCEKVIYSNPTKNCIIK
jgi:RNA-directed DNA polymerase